VKEKALARLEAPDIKLERLCAGGERMKFLQCLPRCRARRARARLPIQRTAVPAAADPRIVEPHARGAPWKALRSDPLRPSGEGHGRQPRQLAGQNETGDPVCGEPSVGPGNRRRQAAASMASRS
jgi:hypothetical protein